MIKLIDEIDWKNNKQLVAKYLVPKILSAHKISGEYSISTTGTNLVCLFPEWVLKIYAPSVGRYKPQNDIVRELYLNEKLKRTDLVIPTIMGHGSVEMDFKYHYLLMTRLIMPPLKEQISRNDLSVIKRVGALVLEAMDVINDISVDVTLGKQNSSGCSASSNARHCVVHGDLSGDNILYDGEQIAIIDYEDWMYTSKYAEYPALVFDLLMGNQKAIESFFSRPITMEFCNEIKQGINSHYRKQEYLNKIEQDGALSWFPN